MDRAMCQYVCLLSSDVFDVICLKKMFCINYLTNDAYMN